MNVKNAMIQLAQYIREGENCSCPFFISKEGKLELAIFTYFASSNSPYTVFGFGQLLTSDGNDVISTELDIFEAESDLITIKSDPQVTYQEHQHLYDCYYSALQSLVETYEFQKPTNTKELAKLFAKLIPDDAMELYRRICPDYLALLQL